VTNASVSLLYSAIFFSKIMAAVASQAITAGPRRIAAAHPP